MNSLLIDTSNQMLSIAINTDKVPVAEINTNVKVNHSETLMVYLNDLFRIARMEKRDIDRVIVARGPGSYTGVRIGATVAKVLASQLNIPLYSVSSLFAMYASSHVTSNATNTSITTNHKVYPIIDARRGTVFAAGYKSRASNTNIEVILDPAHINFDEINSKDAVFIGNRGDKIAQEISNFRHVQTRIAAVEQYDAHIKEENVHRFVPEYLRLSEAELKWNQQSE